MTQIEQIRAEIERLINDKTDGKHVAEADITASKRSAYLDILNFINSLPAEEEQPSEDSKDPKNDSDHSETLYTYEQINIFANNRAQWQKEQMMKGLCYETKVYRDEEGDGIDTPIESWLALENNEITNLPNIGLKDGDKVKILIIKEDEQ